jgi:hypothetical protein
LIATVHRAPVPQASLITAERYHSAPTFAEYITATVKNHDWWLATYRLAKLADTDVAQARALTARWHLLALSEDWCGDAVNILPFLARLADAAPNRLELRVLGRDANPDIMNTHMTGKSRSIPVVIALASNFVEHGWWGPRPLALQQQVAGEWWELPKDDRRLRIRIWYARDHGRETLREMLELLRSVSPPG